MAGRSWEDRGTRRAASDPVAVQSDQRVARPGSRSDSSHEAALWTTSGRVLDCIIVPFSDPATGGEDPRDRTASTREPPQQRQNPVSRSACPPASESTRCLVISGGSQGAASSCHRVHGRIWHRRRFADSDREDEKGPPDSVPAASISNGEFEHGRGQMSSGE